MPNTQPKVAQPIASEDSSWSSAPKLSGTLKVDHSRGIDDQQTAKIDDPLMQLMERLRIRQ
jgi:hypothetical protein